MDKPKQRLLSLSVRSDCFAHAALEDRQLIGWKLHGHNGESDEQWKQTVQSLIEEYQPTDIVIVEPESSGLKKETRGRKYLNYIEETSDTRELALIRVSQAQIRQAVGAPETATRQKIAEIISQHFIQLVPYLPEPKALWESEDKRILQFIAVGMALAAQQD